MSAPDRLLALSKQGSYLPCGGGGDGGGGATLQSA